MMPLQLRVLALLVICHTCLTLEYAPSRQYIYRYNTQVAFNEPDIAKNTQPKKDVGFKLGAEVNLTPVWNSNTKMLIRLTLSNPQLHSVAWDGKTPKDVKALSKQPLFFQWEGSRVTKVYVPQEDATWAANIKVAIASLLQVQRDSGTREEVDISGRCRAQYAVDGHTVIKNKTLCIAVHDLPTFSNVHPALGTAVTSSCELRYQIQDDIVQSVVSTETFQSRVNIQNTLALTAAVSQDLSLVKQMGGASKVQASTLEEAVQVISTREKLKLVGGPPVATIDSPGCSGAKCELTSLVKTHRAHLESDSAASPSAASCFIDLVAAFRTADKKTITAVLNNPQNVDILLPLIDVVTATQTTAGQASLMEVLDFTETYDISLPERYLLGAAFSTHPSQALLKDLLGLYERQVPDERLRDSIGDAMGAVLYTYSHQARSDQQIVTDVLAAVEKKLSACQESSCTVMQIRVLANAGVAGTLTRLLELAETAKDATVSEAAIKALRRMDHNTEQVKIVLRRIFLQEKRHYDSVVRNCALDLILADASVSELRDIVRTTSEPGQSEQAMYMLARFQILAQQSQEFRERLARALGEESLYNYDVLAPKGKALAFREFMAETSSFLATYDMYVQNSKAGVLKRSGMDVALQVGEHSVPLYSFNIFAAGLEGLLGEEVEAGQEDVLATAGLALNLLDVSLRPVTFFTGQSGLMSAVWNAPSSLVSALQVNLLLQDVTEYLPLLNGLILRHNVQGALSMDLSGLISISLWSKNCKSLIKNSGSLLIKGSLGIDTNSFQSGIVYTAEGGSVMDFKTDVDFYDKILMCLQMGRPASAFKHRVSKYESASGMKKGYVARMSRTTQINAASYPLPKANNDQCRELLKDQ